MRKDGTNGRGEYRTMLVSDFAARPSRQIHELVSGILLGVESLADDSALIVPLDGAGAMSIANLRSAVNRATKAGRSRLEPSRTKRTLRLEETSDRPLDNQDPTPPAPQLMTEE
jgi:hypothetical protein